MAVYGTKEYYREEVAKAEARLELLTYAVVKRVGGMSGKIENADTLNSICQTYTEAYRELEGARRDYVEHSCDEGSSEEGT